MVIKTRKNIIDILKHMDNITFYTYNRFVSSEHSYDKNGMVNLIHESYYTQKLPLGNSISYSDLEEMNDKELKELWSDLENNPIEELKDDKQIDNVYICHEYTVSGDYGGNGSVGISNKNVLLEDHKHIEVIGGYGSSFCVIPLVFLLSYVDEVETDEQEERNQEIENIIEIYSSLNDYPVIDEEEMSDVEEELKGEAFDNWVEYDFKRELQDKFNLYDLEVKEGKESEIRGFFELLAERSNEYWINENNDMWISVEKVIDGSNVTLEEVKEYFNVEENTE